jgi:hypothetical protein
LLPGAPFMAQSHRDMIGIIRAKRERI